MEKLYTQKEYQLQAEQANKDGLFLYQLVKEQEYTIEVLEYEKKIVSQDVYSEDGEIIGTQEVTDWTALQNVKTVTAEFVQECFLQLSNDFKPVEVQDENTTDTTESDISI